MFSSRKVKIWLLSLTALVVLFIFYNILSQTPVLKVAKHSYEYTDFNVPGMEGGAGRIGDAQVGNIEEARFETLDRKTKRLKRVIGFAKVLHKTGDLWDIDKPFMDIFEDDYTGHFTADSGSVQVETVGSEPSPKDAVLTGNVLIHIVPNSDSEIKEGHIYLDDITYDSDRSMFTTPGSVKYISDDAELVGRGLEIIYDNENNRMVMLKVIEIDFLRVKLLPESAQAQEPVDTAEHVESQDVVASASVSDDQPTDPAPVQSQPAPVDDAKRYICSFTDNVVVEYGRQMVFANELTVSDITESNKKQDPVTTAPVSSSSPANVSDNLAKKLFSKLRLTTVASAAVKIPQTQHEAEEKPPVKEGDDGTA